MPEALDRYLRGRAPRPNPDPPAGGPAVAWRVHARDTSDPAGAWEPVAESESAADARAELLAPPHPWAPLTLVRLRPPSEAAGEIEFWFVRADGQPKPLPILADVARRQSEDKTLFAYLGRLNARNWAAVWDRCQRGDWMLALAAGAGVPRSVRARACAAMVRRVLPLAPEAVGFLAAPQAAALQRAEPAPSPEALRAAMTPRAALAAVVDLVEAWADEAPTVPAGALPWQFPAYLALDAAEPQLLYLDALFRATGRDRGVLDAVKALALLRHAGSRSWEVPIQTMSAASEEARRAAGVDGGTPMEEWMKAGEAAGNRELAAAADLVRAAVPLAAICELLTESAR